ncbi:MBL fold metallo-hydrolase [Chromobacterium subtsugae]|uniref:MBL fold metallo-hydrolase n=1 Tax=Chromobacterium subtsugae TaxID=251747 RepID=UPI000640C59D|nr:MBL fold metallo-hydrolase [Chromobacterium subtsugae]
MKALGKKAAGARLERMRASPMWADDGFRNIYPIAPGLRDPAVKMPSLKDFLCGGERRTPNGPLPVADPRHAWRKPPESGLRATWLGHSTVLLEIDGLRVLTDPVWGPRASPTRLAGPKRFQPAPVRLKELPPLDLVLVSHDHYDHLDYPTIRELAKTPVPFVTSLGVGAHLEAFGVAPQRITELDWWESYRHPSADLTVTATPSQHFSGRGLKDRNATLWSSLAIRTPRHSVFFSGDTGLTGQFEGIRERIGAFDLVMLEVGAYHPAWGDIHLGPDNALKALELLGGGAFLPVHWGTFNLAMHAWDEPADTLLALSEQSNVQLLMPRQGQALEPAHADRVEPWWRAVDTVAAPAVPASDAAADQAKTIPWPLD